MKELAEREARASCNFLIFIFPQPALGSAAPESVSPAPVGRPFSVVTRPPCREADIHKKFICGIAPTVFPNIINAEHIPVFPPITLL